uniref:Predicted protein n=1 Tax=Hordeum vulgare subsp. vulgare TaxID=112509 RepID=F2EHW2_HORVV|nr:predicted protein [Hordeum vulgare subsp. vulgare]
MTACWIWRWGSADGAWRRWCAPSGSGAWSSSGDAGRATAGHGRCSGHGRWRGEVRHGAFQCCVVFVIAQRICLRRRPTSPASARLC